MIRSSRRTSPTHQIGHRQAAGHAGNIQRLDKGIQTSLIVLQSPLEIQVITRRMGAACPGTQAVFSGSRIRAQNLGVGLFKLAYKLSIFSPISDFLDLILEELFYREEDHPLLTIPELSWRIFEASSSYSFPPSESSTIIAATTFSVDVSCIASPEQTIWNFWMKFGKKLHKR